MIMKGPSIIVPFQHDPDGVLNVVDLLVNQATVIFKMCDHYLSIVLTLLLLF